jgi:glycosyltransferase involved in cell wall biosynthesis
LVAYYHAADVFVSMSEHEGFGLPLLETMAFDVPVVAYASTAVPEVMGGAGVLFREKNDPILAELIHLLIEDAELQKRVIQGQRRRWEQNAKTDLGHNLITHLMDGMSQNDGL